MAPLVPIPSACIDNGHWSLVIDVVASLQMQGVQWMAPLAPFPSARHSNLASSHCTGGPTDGAAGARPPRAHSVIDRVCPGRRWP